MSTIEYPVSFLSPKLETRPVPAKGGKGIFARAPVAAGEILTIWSGELFTSATLQLLPSSRQQHSIQVAEDFFWFPRDSTSRPTFLTKLCA